MTVTARVLFGTPQKEIASLLRGALVDCSSASLLAGFATVAGIEAISAPLKAQPFSLSSLIVGAGTYRAFEAMDRLIEAGVPSNRLFVHLGHTRPRGPNARTRFVPFHPMLHSEIYLFDLPDGTSKAFVGSHNLTEFALMGLNGEAAVLLQGASSASEFVEIRNHIAIARQQAMPYAPSMKGGFAWWSRQYVDALGREIDDRPRDSEGTRTVVIVAVGSRPDLPAPDEVVYFELPRELEIQSLHPEVRMYIFANAPATPADAMRRLHEAHTILKCQTVGSEMEQGGRELAADWYFRSRNDPNLIREPTGRVRPRLAVGLQQVRAKVLTTVHDRFDYLFDTARTMWEPELDDSSEVAAPAAELSLLRDLPLREPPERPWRLVRRLRPSDPAEKSAVSMALRDTLPEAGSFVMFSLRRRKLARSAST